MAKSIPVHGVGVGLRESHFGYILQNKPAVNWFEALADNYFHCHSIPFENLQRVRAIYPITLHSVGLAIASHEPLNQTYLLQYRALIDQIKPAMISDHLSWSSHGNYHAHELLPVRLTQKNLIHIAQRIDEIQQQLGMPLSIENPSTYLMYQDNEMPEYTFLNQLAEKTQCRILLDINNVYVNSVNHNYDPTTYLDNIAMEYVAQFHLGGHSVHEDYLVDDHGAHVTDDVWALYDKTLSRRCDIPTIIEWDTNVPPFPVLLEEVSRAEAIGLNYGR